MRQVPLTLRCWTRSEYNRLVHLGVLHDEPVGSPLALATVRIAVGDLLP